MDADGHELSCWFGRTIINNKCRLDYAGAQGIIDGSITREEQLEERYRCVCVCV